MQEKLLITVGSRGSVSSLALVWVWDVVSKDCCDLNLSGHDVFTFPFLCHYPQGRVRAPPLQCYPHTQTVSAAHQLCGFTCLNVSGPVAKGVGASRMYVTCPVFCSLILNISLFSYGLSESL